MMSEHRVRRSKFGVILDRSAMDCPVKGASVSQRDQLTFDHAVSMLFALQSPDYLWMAGEAGNTELAGSSHE